MIINEPEWPPYYMTDNSKPGFAKELLSIILTNLNYDFEFQLLPIARGNFYMKNGNADISIFSYKKQRSEFLHYGKIPIFTIKIKFVSRIDANFQINKISDISPLRFEFVRGISYTENILQHANASDKNIYTSVILKNALKKIINHRSDLTAASEHTLNDEILKLNAYKELKIHKFVVTAKAYYLTVSKKSTLLIKPLNFLNEIDKEIIKLKLNGTYQKLENKYHLLEINK
ncbi:substrate-binding periplasmic protein [Pseudoalteromonas denitrificans]|uniref:substrate-binding periplasmic protein n=1 Tax=Pseudoalteromonas denitrificans TaxID=43656 RepID=UPI001C432011|nr:transporter substrate-binding domain-containing protein [Pseudoalteromonas denitrificans]